MTTEETDIQFNDTELKLLPQKYYQVEMGSIFMKPAYTHKVMLKMAKLREKYKREITNLLLENIDECINYEWALFINDKNKQETFYMEYEKKSAKEAVMSIKNITKSDVKQLDIFENPKGYSIYSNKIEEAVKKFYSN